MITHTAPTDFLPRQTRDMIRQETLVTTQHPTGTHTTTAATRLLFRLATAFAAAFATASAVSLRARGRRRRGGVGGTQADVAVEQGRRRSRGNVAGASEWFWRSVQVSLLLLHTCNKGSHVSSLHMHHVYLYIIQSICGRIISVCLVHDQIYCAIHLVCDDYQHRIRITSWMTQVYSIMIVNNRHNSLPIKWFGSLNSNGDTNQNRIVVLIAGHHIAVHAAHHQLP